MSNVAEDIEEVTSGDAGSSLTIPTTCGSLRKGGMVCIKNHPCKIVEMSTSKTGKHGSAKVNLTGIDIFTNKKYEECCPSSATMAVPNVKRQEYELLDIEDGFLSLFDGENVRSDIALPDNEVGKTIQTNFERMEKEGIKERILVTIISAMDEEHAISVRTAAEDKK